MIDYGKFTFEEREHLKDLAKDHLLGELLSAMSAKYMESWRASGSADVEKREHAYRMVLAVDELKAELKGVELDERLKRKVPDEAPKGTTDPVMDLRRSYLKRAGDTITSALRRT